MEWNAANRSIRDHRIDGRTLLFFERFQRSGGLWLFKYHVHCVGVRVERRKDKDGFERSALIFELLPTSDVQILIDPEARIEGVRALTAPIQPRTDTQEEPHAAHRVQSVAIRQYVLMRANGVCEGCGLAAPFRLSGGQPYLEPHYLFQQADRGPATPLEVVALCPNCHKRCHYSEDAEVYGALLAKRVVAKEA